jgi:RimJ/RimL family protein N-acetyltransferase
MGQRIFLERFGGIGMEIRKAEEKDLEKILQLYAAAREQMKRNGNPTQWGDHRPSEAVIRADLEAGNSYVLEEEGILCGVFAFIPGVEPTYQRIEEGKWLNEEPYGTIHRVASDGTKRGVMRECLRYCEAQCSNIRIDTHRDNSIMQHLLKKYGFQLCGIIYVEDGTPRLAYQKIIENYETS